ncbi:hypothetical protein [Gimesia sp.]|uniref:hypothetical protein n=1 Tax=Gimesia sp. TaxID=2024833 RepID=UPI003A8D48DB
MNAVKLASIIGDALSSINHPVDHQFTEVKNDTIKLITKARRNRINTDSGLVTFDDKEILTASIKSVTENIVIEIESVRLIQSSNGQKPVAPPEGEANKILLQLKTAMKNFGP